jgi:hypothetical protein
VRDRRSSQEDDFSDAQGFEYPIGSSSFHGPILIVVDDTIDQTHIYPNKKPPVSNLMKIDVLVPTGEGAMAHEGQQPTKLH